MPSARRTYVMLGSDSLWQTAERCHQALLAAGVAHAICGGVAVCLHGYRRNTIDLDLLIRRQDSDTTRTTLEKSGLIWDEGRREFMAESGVPVQFLMAGDRAGKNSEVYLPDPADANMLEAIEGLPVLSLAKLIEAKIACGEGDMRRTHKDFADVIELIVVRNLDSSFARFLHKSLRSTYRKLVHRTQI